MTNSEYEAASVAAAGCYDRLEGDNKLRQIDEIIKNLETSLANLHEQRREIVNQYNLNKCKHDYVWHTGYARWYCSKCEATK